MIKELIVSRITDVSTCELRDWGLFPDRSAFTFCFLWVSTQPIIYLFSFFNDALSSLNYLVYNVGLDDEIDTMWTETILAWLNLIPQHFLIW
jgi:hypothetical protein